MTEQNGMSQLEFPGHGGSYVWVNPCLVAAVSTVPNEEGQTYIYMLGSDDPFVIMQKPVSVAWRLRNVV